MTGATGAMALPAADPLSAAHSERVAGFLRQRIAEAGGSISFADYMHQCLYAPGLGYYSAGSTKLGPGGDFVTAPEVSTLFGRVLARQCRPLLEQTGSPQLLELGAGSGKLAGDMLEWFAEANVALERYAILEISPDLRRRQAAYLQRRVPQFRDRIEWLSGLPARFSGVVVANEVADALPVERFCRRDGAIRQQRVCLADQGFAWCEASAPAFLETAVSRVEDYLGRSFPEGYVSEISTALPGWIRDIAAGLDRAFLFVLDYGLTRREYYAPDRDGGWLRCHYRHRAHEDPFVYPGIQDITAWVDFTTIAEAAADAGLDVAGYVTQAQFLLQGGLQEELADFASLSTAAQTELSQQVKLLTLPGEMGEHFKCIGLCSDGLQAPVALVTGDRTHTL